MAPMTLSQLRRLRRRSADPYRMLLAAVFVQAIDDLRDNHRHYAAVIWLQSEVAEEWAAYLDIDLPKDIIKRKERTQHGK